MKPSFNEATKEVAEEIISISQLIEPDIETWNDVFSRVPTSTSKNVSTGFIAKPTTKSGIEIVIDVQAPPDNQSARLRVWAIETIKDRSGNERFNNVQLNYSLDYKEARKLVEQAQSPTLAELQALLHDHKNKLNELVISDMTGKDEATGQQLGHRYDYDIEDLETLQEEDYETLLQLLNLVVSKLKRSATKAFR